MFLFGFSVKGKSEEDVWCSSVGPTVVAFCLKLCVFVCV